MLSCTFTLSSPAPRIGLGAAATAALFAAQTVGASPVPAGTLIESTAEATYDEGGVYETGAAGGGAINAGVRAEWERDDGAVRIGATAITDETEGLRTNVAVADTRLRLGTASEVRAEVGVSEQDGDTANAWLVELQHQTGKLDVVAYARQIATGYGTGQQSIAEAGRRKLGADSRYQITDQLSATASLLQDESLADAAQRRGGQVELVWRSPATDARLGLARFDDRLANGERLGSTILQTAASQRLFDNRLEISGASAEIMDAALTIAHRPDGSDFALLGRAEYRSDAVTGAVAGQLAPVGRTALTVSGDALSRRLIGSVSANWSPHTRRGFGQISEIGIFLGTRYGFDRLEGLDLEGLTALAGRDVRIGLSEMLDIGGSASLRANLTDGSYSYAIGQQTNFVVAEGTLLSLVSVAIERNDATASWVTCAGEPLTLLGRLTNATLEIWGRLAPTSGTHPVVVTLGNSAATVVGAISFANVSQTNAIAAGQLFGFNGGTSASGSVASTADHLVIATIAANDEVDTVTPGAGQISRWNVVNAADVIGAGSTKNGAAGSTTMSYTFPDPGRSVIGVIALQQVSPLIVTNTNDSDFGSLRNAITFANSDPGANTISFAIPGAGPHTITLSSSFPALSDNGTIIDGPTQPGSQCRDLWAGGGHDLRINVRGGGFDGIVLSGSNQTIRGLSLTNFDNASIAAASSSGATVGCNYLGLLANGTSSGNTRGVVARGASALVGGLDPGQGNVIAANSIVGVLTENGSTDTAIRGNIIGTDAAGMTARANGGGGINNFAGPAT